MSYILNALRKSERERQAVEPDTLANRIILHQPAHHRNSSWLIIALILMNLAILIYFLGFSQKTPRIDSAVVAAKPQQASGPEILEEPVELKRAPAPKSPPVSHNIKAEASAKSVPVIPPTDKKPQTPANQAATSNQAAEIKKSPGTGTLITKTVPPAAPVPVPAGTPSIDSTKQAATPIRPNAQPAEPLKSLPEKHLATPTKNDLPFVEQLPAEFQRTLPELPINVYSYSAAADERFVMIDMVKYVPGQRIKDALDLKEIRSDGIVVGYEGRTFVIRRP